MIIMSAKGLPLHFDLQSN